MKQRTVARRSRDAFILAGALVAVLGTLAPGGVASAAVAPVAIESAAMDCQEQTVTSVATADTWLDENSPSATKGSDSVLNVSAGSVNVDTGLTSGRARALVRFPLPNSVPPGCVVESARLQLVSLEGEAGTKLDAVRLASTWVESQATWSNQPATSGTAVRTWSRAGVMRWNVTPQVEAMLQGANHGFVVREAAEGAEEGGGSHGFYSREKGESPPELVIRFAAPPSEEPPGPPAPPVPAQVVCGQVLTQSTLVTNDLSDCPGDGLVVGADRIIVDLDGHRIDGVGLGSGILNDGHDLVTVSNGTVQEFDYGVQLPPETERNTIERLTLRLNQVAAVELFDVVDSEIRGNTLDQNGGGILLVSGTKNVLVTGNAISANGGAGLLVVDSAANRLEHNTVDGGGDLGIGLERATGNMLLGNTVSSNSDGGIEISAGSHDNHVEGNTVTESGDHGILVRESDRNQLISNVTHRMSDSGINLDGVHDSVVRGNDVRFNTGGLQIDGSSRNLLESNNASNTTGIGIELGGGSLENNVVRNTAVQNGAQGIYVADDATDMLGNAIPGLGNLLHHNNASANLADGMVMAKGGHILTGNTANNNSGWGINAAVGTIDGSGNVARLNLKPEQCVGVVCRVDWEPPETTITDQPADSTISSAASLAFTSTELGSFECRLDGEDSTPWSACSSPRSYTGLAEGPHTFEVRATDRAGNTDPTPATATWTIEAADTTAPETIIDSRPGDLTTSTSASFTFSGDVGSSFHCSLDQATFAPCSNPRSYADLAEGPHTFEVRATDPAGNTDPSPATATWTIDTTAPETTIDSWPNDPSANTAAAFGFSADESGSNFQCSLDGAPFTTCDSPASYPDLTEGSHTFEVRATDPAGNTDPTPATYTWTVDTIAPETTIDLRPADPTNSANGTLRFTADEPGSDFQCSLDGAPFTTCDSPASYPDLTEGSHTFEVRATDPAGNTDPTPATATWVVDTLAPETTITDRPADPTNSSSATLRFSADEPGSDFQCSLDGAAFIPCESPVSNVDLIDGTHTFEVRATDPAGNTDPTPATYTWTVDTIAPETTIDLRPEDPTNSANGTLRFTADDAGSDFQCSLDGAPFTTCDSPASYPDLTEGSHTFEVRATDPAGNTDPTPATYTWTIDTTAPETTIDSRPDDPTANTAAALGFSADESGSDFQCSLDGAPFTTCDSPASYPDLTEGSHTFEVRATDPAGNTDPTPATATWVVDTLAPETTITDRPADPTNSSSATLRFSADEPGSDFQCSLDGAAFIPCESPVSNVDLIDGTHTFEVRATDPAGNTDPTPATYTWTVDTIAPETTIDLRPADPSNATSASFDFSSQPGSTFACSLDAAAFTPCDSPVKYPDLTDGTHTFEVRATDPAGNTDPTPATSSWTIDTLAPETTITDRPADPTNSSSATPRFSADEADSTFVCSLDGAPFTACDSPVSYADLAQGTHTFEVRATDPAGNTDPTPATATWVVDTTAPQTTMTDGPADPTNSANGTLRFTADETGSDFQCSLDGGAFTACDAQVSYAGLTEGPHTFEVRATDPAGNTDPTPATYTWTVDTIAPETTIDLRPADPSNATSATFTFSSEPGSTFQCALDNGAFDPCTSPRSYAGLAEGPHTFEVRATDPAGNTDPTAATHTWTIQVADTTPPQTTIDSRPAATTSSTSALFTFSASQTGSTFACSLDGGVFTSCTSPRSYAGLSPGSHTFRVRATDPAGNADLTPAVATWTVDINAPQTTINSGPAAVTGNASASFTFSASQTGSTFACSLDGAPFTSCASPSNYTGLTPGSHTFRVRATDPAGNTDPTPATRTWSIQAVDTTPPQTTITTGPAAPTSSSSAFFTFTASETGSTFACSLDGASFTSCASPSNYTGLTPGSHTFRVRATDPAGNTDPTPATLTWTISTSSACPPAATLNVAEDAWIDQNSPSSNKGTDSVLKIQSKAPADNFRALVRFHLPAVPAGCVLDTARLRLFAASTSASPRTLEAFRLGGSWTEAGVTWANAPQTVGASATTTSGTGYREWDVAALVSAMYSSGANHGFLIKDATEGQDAEQQFHAREKGSDVPQLAITFRPAS